MLDTEHMPEPVESTTSTSGVLVDAVVAIQHPRVDGLTVRSTHALSSALLALALAGCGVATSEGGPSPADPGPDAGASDAPVIPPPIDAPALPPPTPASGLYIVDRGDGFANGRILFRAPDGTVSVRASGLDRPSSLTFGNDGFAYVTTFGPEPGGVRVYDVATWQFVRWYADGASSQFNGYLDESVRLVLRGNLGFVLSNDQSHVVVAPYPTSSLLRTFGDSVMMFPHDMVVGPDGLFYVAVEDTPTTHAKVQVWNADTGTKVKELASDIALLDIVTGLAFQADGKLLVVDWSNGSIYRYDTQTGARTRIGGPLAPALRHPVSVLPWTGTNLLVVDERGVGVVSQLGLYTSTLVPVDAVSPDGLRAPQKVVHIP